MEHHSGVVVTRLFHRRFCFLAAAAVSGTALVFLHNGVARGLTCKFIFLWRNVTGVETVGATRMLVEV